MKLYYRITGKAHRIEGGKLQTVELPPFYLDRRIQGIMMPAHADRIAVGMVNTHKDPGIAVDVVADLLELDQLPYICSARVEMKRGSYAIIDTGTLFLDFPGGLDHARRIVEAIVNPFSTSYLAVHHDIRSV